MSDFLNDHIFNEKHEQKENKEIQIKLNPARCDALPLCFPTSVFLYFSNFLECMNCFYDSTNKKKKTQPNCLKAVQRSALDAGGQEKSLEQAGEPLLLESLLGQEGPGSTSTQIPSLAGPHTCGAEEPRMRVRPPTA